MVIVTGATLLSIAGIAATGIELGMESANYSMGRESVFDLVTGGPQTNKDAGQAFLEKCKQTGGQFSKRCPKPEPPPEPPPGEPTARERVQLNSNIALLILVAVGVYFVKNFL